MRFTSSLWLLLPLACAGAQPPATAPPAATAIDAGQPRGMPTREDFFRELVEPRPLPTSASFRDGAPDSYHVDKLELWREFPSFLRSRGLELRGLVILGPTGPLWSYFLFAFFDEGERVRVNEVVFPHARLTAKQTGLLTREQAEAWLATLAGLPGLQEIPPVPEALEAGLPPTDLGDFRFDLLVLYPIEPTRAFVSGHLPESPRAERAELYAPLEALASMLEPTYQHGDEIPGE
jgi:hypothetical protein